MSSSKNKNSRAKTLIALHLLLLVYSLSGLFSKSASKEPLLSWSFVCLYAGMLLILGIYAIGWQQILKRLSLSLAFANKAVTVVWGMFWGWAVFGEQISLLNLIGASMVIAGVVLYAWIDGKEEKLDAPIDGDEWIARNRQGGPDAEGNGANA